jgi:hypothetical protein
VGSYVMLSNGELVPITKMRMQEENQLKDLIF